MKLATFTWSVSVEVPDTFDIDDPDDNIYTQAQKDAYDRLRVSGGLLTDVKPV